MSEYFHTHRKAFAGAAVAGATGAITAISAGGDWKAAVIAAVVAALGGGVGVGAIPNRPAKPKA
jgi:Na+/citrate or Na+/malate symporter